MQGQLPTLLAKSAQKSKIGLNLSDQFRYVAERFRDATRLKPATIS